jgi:general secretion pathway protein D
VRIWPDKVANRLIVAAPKSKFPDIQKLITTLDTAKPQDVTVRVLPLKNASAEELVRELGPLYQKMGGKSVKEAVEIAANTRANSLVVLSSEINFKAIEKLITTLDTDEAQEKIMRAFTLKNADAEDVAKQLRDLQQDSQSSSSPFRIFYFSDYPSGGRGGPKKPTIVADRRRNTVIVQAPPAQMETLAKMIQTLDEPVEDDGLAPRIFRLKYVSASDIEDVLNELFMKKQQQRQYWDYYYGSPPEDTSDRQGRLFGKVRITSEPYSNSIIVSGNSTESLTAVEDMLKQLDVPSQAGDTTLRIGLKFAKATTVANSVNILFAKGGSPPLRPVAQPAQGNDASRPNQQPPSYSQSSFGLEQEQKEEGYFPWLGGQPESYYRSFDGRSAVLPVSDLVGRVRVVADRRSNSLLVTAKMHYFPQVIKLIDELDAPTPQVMIEAKIIEVASDFREKLGVRWSQDPTSFDAEDLDNAIAIKNTASYNKVFAGSALANSLQTGILDSSVNLNVLIQFLQKNIDSKVLAEPQINIADNEMGKLFVGSQVPFIDRSLQTDVGGLNQSFSYKDVGIILEVTPHINDDGEVALKIRAESSSIRPGEKVFGGLILDTRNFRTDLMVKNGQTIVLGGILQRAQQDTLRKTPFLGSIPGLGWLFKKKDNLAREVELMVFLRPQVIRTPEEAKRLKEEAEKKSPLIQKWDNENLENTQKKSETK